MNKINKVYKKYEEIIVYLLSGLLATVVNLVVKYGLLFTVLEASNPTQLQISVILSWIAACLCAYITNRKYVFKSESKNILKEFANFLIARIATLGLEMLIMFIFVTALGFDSDIWVVVWTLVAQTIVVITNYFLSKLFIFKKKEGSER